MLRISHWAIITRSFTKSVKRPQPLRLYPPKTKYKHSYVHGPSDRPLLGLNVGQVIDEAAEKYGDREGAVFVHQGIRKSFYQLKEEANILAAGLICIGLKRGDRIGIWGPNSYEWLLTQYAAAKAGLVLVNVNPAYQPNELLYCINKVEMAALVTAESFKFQHYYELISSVVPEIEHSSPGEIQSKHAPSLKSVIMISDVEHRGTFKFSDLLLSSSKDLLSQVETVQKKVQFDEPANIQFTSGTTGYPKGATLSHHNIVNNAYLFGFRIGYHEQEHRICLPNPLYHCFGCVAGSLAGPLHGAALIVPSSGFNPEKALEAIHTERCTSLYGTPTMFVDMIHAFDLSNAKFDVSSLSTGAMAGAPCPEELVKGVINKLHMRDFIVMYGMTETSPVSLQCFNSDPPEVKSTTVGYPTEHVEIKIVNEEGEITPINTAGEICVRGHCNMLYYWNDEDKTKEIIAEDRWLKTGDIGVIDENGYGQIVGRVKDMIIRGGENIYPREIEEFLYTHPEVMEAHVCGVPDERMGEEVCAWIRLTRNSSTTEEILRNYCNHKISHFKIPRYWFFTDEFPKTVTGKIQKYKMKEISIKHFDLNQ
ncbi:medium-chain acyl-CoA ligase ACSF2, mitochondrial-like [Artemia franciscana]